MTLPSTRRLSFAGSSVSIKYSGSTSADLVDFLFRHIPVNSDIPPHLTYHLQPGDRPGEATLYREELLLHRGDQPAMLAEQFLGDVCYHLAERSRGGLLFHAAALTWQGRGFILPGMSGAGKTTLAAWLLSQGFDYLTDELVFVPDGANTLQTFTRPLNLKANMRSTLAQFLDIEGQSESILSSPASLLVPPTLLKPTNTLSEPPPSLVIFPRYCPHNNFELHPLTRARSGLALMECLVNARNLPDHGFTEIARLIRQVPAYRMSYGSFAQLAGQIQVILEK